MKKLPLILFSAAGVFFAITLFLWKKEKPSPPPNDLQAEENSSLPEEVEETNPQISGFLRNYGSPDLPPENDLLLLGDLLDLFRTTLKQADSLPTSGNREIVKALQGSNAHREVFLPSGFTFLDKQGRLLDRWQTPLYFHFVSARSPEIRSAGPDLLLWTEDDLSKLP
ncbi:MAG: hypothetical protein ACSHYB_05935 [Roseibacillus sp.]